MGSRNSCNNGGAINVSAYNRQPTEAEILLGQLRQLERENEKLRAELKEKNQTIARAKDCGAVTRPTFMRVLRVVHNACMDLKRVTNGWVLTMGNRIRTFKRLTQIWDLLTTDDWVLSEIFSPPKPEPKRDRISPPAPTLRLPKRNPPIAPAMAYIRELDRIDNLIPF